MGDPAGIGPEISVKAAISPEINNISNVIIFGSLPIIKYYRNLMKIPIEVRAIEKPQEYRNNVINVISVNDIEMDDFAIGKVFPICGESAFKYVKSAIEYAQNKEIAAITTAPLNKDALNRAGIRFSGHTEILANLTNTKDYAMMLATDLLKVVHVTTHVSLKEACDLVSKNRVLQVIKLTNDAVKSFDKKLPKIAVAGLNPHAGESGLFGKEEQEQIIPAVKMALELGINVEGPIPPDTVFCKAVKGKYDIVVVMYHDQGHIPIKLLGFEEGVNITLGLPIIRTSVDHGTAYDIAGKGIASEKSMLNAIKYAVKML